MVNAASAELNISQSMTLKHGYSLALKEISFDRPSGIKKVKLELMRDGKVIDEQTLQNEKMSGSIKPYIYSKNISGKMVKIIKADVDVKYSAEKLLFNPSNLNLSCRLYNIYQFWEDDPKYEPKEQPELRILKVEVASLYGINMAS